MFQFLFRLIVLQQTLTSLANGRLLDKAKFATRIVHAGCEYEHSGSANPVIPPISLASTFVQSTPGNVSD
jgi:hypothetical protein